MNSIAALLLTLGLAGGTADLPAQPPPAPDMTLDAAARAQVIEGALRLLDEGYIFPEVARQMEEAIRAHQKDKEYDAITSAQELARRLTDDLRAVGHDKHLKVTFSPEALPPEPSGSSADAAAETERQRAVAARQNFSFVRVERLAGNVGYLDFRRFPPPDLAGETAAAAMTFLASCDAVILDLRKNHGGHPEMVAFLSSYLFGPEPVHLNDFYDRATHETHSSWTLASVPGKRLPHADVYLLTSPETASGAEGFAYNLKQLKRATVVGETTSGAAHPSKIERINDHFAIRVPWGRPINAVTKTDWEGVGVEPDVKVAAEKALDTAHLLALEKRQKTAAPDLAAEIATTMASLRQKLGVAAPAGQKQPPPPARADHPPAHAPRSAPT